MTVRRIAVLTVAAGITAAAAACSSTAPKPLAPAASPTAASFPDSPAGNQARWLFGAVTHLPIPVAAVQAHFDNGFLAKVGPSELNEVFESAGTLRLDAITLSTPGELVMTVTANGQTQLNVTMAVDSEGLISGLLLQPALPPAPTTWAGVESQIRSVAPQVRMLVAAVSGGTCQPIQAIDATTPAPLGSAFKLYVLDALARAVAAGKVTWGQELTITSQLKSLPSGVLQNQPDGTRVTVRQAAADMISISDNTAAGMLITLLGRPAVEAAASSSGMADPSRDVPFLTPRELFVLKLDDWPQLAGRYLALDAAGRQALLSGTVDRVPYSTLTALNAAAWTAPRDIDSLEWFASPADICRVYASLATLARQPGLSPVASVLEINNGDMSLDPNQWRSVWYKGGSEPGVLTLNYLATTRDGRSYVVSVLAENPAASIQETAAELTLISAIKGAFELAAQP
jgi:beta-lactamase class A